MKWVSRIGGRKAKTTQRDTLVSSAIDWAAEEQTANQYNKRSGKPALLIGSPG